MDDANHADKVRGEHDLVPARCVQCGSVADHRSPRPFPETPRARTALWLVPAAFLLYLCVSGIALFVHRFFQHTSVAIPVCNLHHNHWRCRDRVRSRYLRPVFFGVSVAVEVVCFSGLLLHPLLFAHAAARVVPVAVAVDFCVINQHEVLVSRDGRDGVQLARVHPDFIAAVVEDRTRDRVDNPARRPPPGDVRDDFDDEPQ